MIHQVPELETDGDAIDTLARLVGPSAARSGVGVVTELSTAEPDASPPSAPALVVVEEEEEAPPLPQPAQFLTASGSTNALFRANSLSPSMTAHTTSPPTF